MVLQGLVVVKLRLDAKASDNGPIVTVFFSKLFYIYVVAAMLEGNCC